MPGGNKPATKAGGDPAGTPGKARGEYVPPGYTGRIEALTDLIRFGPDALGDAEFAVCLYIAERTLPFGKRSDKTSRSQMVRGIFSRKNGAWIRGGCGLSESGVKKGIRSLLASDVLKKQLGREENGAHSAARYSIDWLKLKALLDAVRNRPEELPALGHQETTLGHQETKGRARSNQTLGHQETKPLVTTCPHRGDISESSSSEYKKQISPEAHPSTAASMGQSGKSGGQTNAFFSLKVDDDDSGKEYASPKDELKGLFQKLTGDSIPERDLTEIQHLLEMRLKSMAGFLAELKKQNLQGLRNPIGFMKSLAKKSYAPASAPELAPPPPPEKCEHCNCVKGEGILLTGDQFEACPECATPETIAKVEAIKKRDQESRERKERRREARERVRMCAHCDKKGYLGLSPWIPCPECNPESIAVSWREIRPEAVQ